MLGISPGGLCRDRYDKTRKIKRPRNSSTEVKIPPSLAPVVGFFLSQKLLIVKNYVVGGLCIAQRHGYLTRLSTPPSSSTFLKPFKNPLLAEMVFKGKYMKLVITMYFTPLRKQNVCNKCRFFWNSGKQASHLCDIVLDIPK